MMYFASYWLLYSNRQNTFNDREYLVIWIYWNSVSFNPNPGTLQKLHKGVTRA